MSILLGWSGSFVKKNTALSEQFQNQISKLFIFCLWKDCMLRRHRSVKYFKYQIVLVTISLKSDVSLTPIRGNILRVTCVWTNEHSDCDNMKMLLNCFVCYEGHSHVTRNGVSSDLPRLDISVKGNKWETFLNITKETISSLY